MKMVVSYLDFVFFIEVKAKSKYKILNFVFQFIKKSKWHFGYTDLLKQISYETSYHLAYAIVINNYKRIKQLIKHQIFVSKYLPVQTPRNKHQQRIFDLFKLINKDTRVVINILFQRCCYHFSTQYYVTSGCFYCLFYMINGKTSIDAKI